jgi:hypothetical protein
MALEKFRRISKLKQALERRPPIRRTSYFAKLPAPAFAKASPAPASAARPRRPVFDLQAMRSTVTLQQISTEKTKLRQVEESIRIFVRVADPKFRQVVPMRFFNLTLTPAEADACSADYLEEKSLRGGVARVLLRIVAVVARVTTELEELKRAENSASLWKLHADSLLALMGVADALSENAAHAMAEASNQGDNDGKENIKVSLQRLRQRCDLIAGAFAEASGETQRV